MSETPKDNPFEEFKRQMQDLFGKAGAPFFAGAPAAAEAGATPPAPSTPDALARIRAFNRRPREIKEHLDRFVVRQDEAKKVISVALCDHYHWARRCLEDPALAEQDLPKQNVLLLGPTGVGKTHLIRTAARLIGVPFVKADATKFSETGYVGADVEDLVRDLVKLAEGDTDLARFGIVYLDEVDKLASAAGAGGRDVSGRGVQVNLLKLMEDAEVNLLSQTDMLGQMQAAMEFQRTGKRRQGSLNTRHILFIVSGAFGPLAEIVKKRVGSRQIGFNTVQKILTQDHEYLAAAETPDFIQFGFEPEFVGRLPVRVALEPLDRDDLVRILGGVEGGVLARYKADFEGYGIELEFTPESLEEIAARAEREKTGARGLLTVLERALRDFKFELPSLAVRRLTVDLDLLQRPQDTLDRLREAGRHERLSLHQREVEAFAQRLHEEHGLTLVFQPEAVERLLELGRESDRTIRTVCEERFKDLHYGLKLVRQATGQSEFRVDREMVDNADQALSRLIVRTYRQGDAPDSGPTAPPA
jgi:endopeptidase Clp ATP-binding regulatory subunit ClpX